nr:MAG TPA: hypothetical protein [Caudoviricetes sp.]
MFIYPSAVSHYLISSGSRDNLHFIVLKRFKRSI